MVGHCGSHVTVRFVLSLRQWLLLAQFQKIIDNKLIAGIQGGGLIWWHLIDQSDELIYNSETNCGWRRSQVNLYRLQSNHQIYNLFKNDYQQELRCRLIFLFLFDFLSFFCYDWWFLMLSGGLCLFQIWAFFNKNWISIANVQFGR